MNILSTEHPVSDVRRGKSGKSLTEQAYEILRRQIITCQLAPGAEISEQELSDLLNMSKTPVREALMRLCLEGFVETFPRRGYRIAHVTIKALNDLFGVRALLEGEAAALAATNLTALDLERLQVLADASYKLDESKSREEFVEANRDFHLAISLGAGNQRLHQLIVSHLDEGQRFFHLGAQARDVNAETNEEHHDIVRVLREGDAAQARQTMMAHIESTRSGLLASLLASQSSGLSF